MFHKLGVPDVSKAEYIKFDDGRYGGYRHIEQNGDAWLLSDDGDKGFTIIKNNVKITYQKAPQVRKRLEKESAELKKKFKDKPRELAEAEKRLNIKYGKIDSGTYKKVDLKKDIDTLMKNLEPMEKQGRNSFYGISSEFGKLLLFAVNVYDKGYKFEANKIADIAFKVGGRKQVIIMAVNQLANGFYDKVYDNFRKSGDWKKYYSELDALVKKFPSWREKPQIELLMTRIKEKIAGKAPELKAKDLSPQDIALAGQLVNAVSFPSIGLWLLPSKECRKVSDSIVLPENQALKKIFDGGVKSLPLLIALLDDNYLTDIPVNVSVSEYYNDYSREDKYDFKQAYENMRKRPASRRDIAKILLNAVLADSDRDDEKDALAVRAAELYKQLKDKNGEEMAAYYLKKPNYAGVAVHYLCEKSNPKYIALIEKYFLDNASLDTSYVVRGYLDKRGHEAKEFAEKYLKLVKSGLGKRLKEEARNRAENRQQLDNIKKELDKRYEKLAEEFEMYTSPETAEELLMKIAAQKEWDEKYFIALRFKCSKVAYEKLVPMLLKAAVAAKNLKVKHALINLIAMHRYAPRIGKSIYFKDFKGTKALWMKLINDNTPVPDTSSTISEIVLSRIEQISEDGEGLEEQSRLVLLPERYTKFIRVRGLARLEGKTGKELPKPPSAANVSDAEYQKLVAKLLKTPEADLAGEISKLSDDMLLKLMDNLDKNKQLNQKLLPLSNKIVKVENRIKDKKISAQLPQIKGSLDEKLVRTVLESLKKIKPGEKRVACYIKVNNGLAGVEITFSLDNRHANNNANRSWNMRRINTGVNYLTATLSNSEKYINCAWPVKKEKTKKAEAGGADEDLFAEAEAELNTSLEQEQTAKEKEFWQAVKEFQNRTNAAKGGGIYFQYR
jgi:hypothetical protein